MIKSEKKDVLAKKTEQLATWLEKFPDKKRKDLLNQSLVNAVQINDSFLVEILILLGADVTAYNNYYSIQIASEKGYTEIVKLLIEAGADVTADNNYPIWGASAYGYTEIVKLLIDNGAEVTDELIKRVYYYQSTSSNLKVVELLVSALEKKKTDKIK